MHGHQSNTVSALMKMRTTKMIDMRMLRISTIRTAIRIIKILIGAEGNMILPIIITCLIKILMTIVSERMAMMVGYIIMMIRKTLNLK